MKIQVSTLETGGDARGLSFSMPREALDFLGEVADVRIAASGPGTVRGNHFHLQKRQALISFPGPAWSLHWDEGEGTQVQQRSFDGRGAVMALIPPGCSIAVRNDGEQLLWLVTSSSKPYDSAEIVARKVI